MSVWHTVTDSRTFRRVTIRGPGRVVMRSRAVRRANVETNRVRTAVAMRRMPDAFNDVSTFFLFVGHNKSGTSMVGGLLDAHPKVVCSDEVDLLRYVDAGFTGKQLFHLVDRGSRAELRKGRVTARRLQPYSYLVPGQCQGRTDRPRVVGDGTCGTTTRRLAERPELLDRLGHVAPAVDVKLLHVIRNPFDPISVMMIRGRRTFENAIDHYFSACRALVEIRARIPDDHLLAVRHERFVADTRRELVRVCDFLGVDTPVPYVDACTSIIRDTPDRSRDLVEWTPYWIGRVERELARFDFLDEYSYEQ